MTEESEEACLVNPKSPLNVGMQYTDGIGSVTAIPSSSSSSMHIHSQQSNTVNNDSNQAQSTTSEHRVHETSINSYDINDDIILSQFHADAIKQVCIFFHQSHNNKPRKKTNVSHHRLQLK